MGITIEPADDFIRFSIIFKSLKKFIGLPEIWHNLYESLHTVFCQYHLYAFYLKPVLIPKKSRSSKETKKNKTTKSPTLPVSEHTVFVLYCYVFCVLVLQLSMFKM